MQVGRARSKYHTRRGAHAGSGAAQPPPGAAGRRRWTTPRPGVMSLLGSDILSHSPSLSLDLFITYSIGWQKKSFYLRLVKARCARERERRTVVRFSIKAVFSLRKSLDFYTVAYFVII